jgi:hypothetical protein
MSGMLGQTPSETSGTGGTGLAGAGSSGAGTRGSGGPSASAGGGGSATSSPSGAITSAGTSTASLGGAGESGQAGQGAVTADGGRDSSGGSKNGGAAQNAGGNIATGGQSGTAGGSESDAGHGGQSGTAGGGQSGTAGSGQIGTAGGGQSGTAGGGQSGTAGGPGQSGTAGAGGFCDPEIETEVIECVFGQNLTVPHARAAAISGVSGTWDGYQVYASKAASDMVATTWNDAPGVAFYSLQCFDALPAPDRMAGTTRLDDSLEVYAVARCGTVWQRRIVTTAWVAWAPWAQLHLPTADSQVTDVAATRLPGVTNFTYIVDRGSVYARYRETPTADSKYTDFAFALAGSGDVIAAGTRSDGSQELFTIDQNGRPLTSTQTGTALNAPFDTWTDLGDDTLPPFVDIDAADGTNPLDVFGLDANGHVWMRREDGNAFTPWALIDADAPPITFRTLAGAGLSTSTDGTMALIGAGTSGVYVIERLGQAWQSWTQLQ